jgi:hypothetical protein
MLTLTTLTIDHRDLVGMSPGPHPTREPTGHPHQMRVVQLGRAPRPAYPDRGNGMRPRSGVDLDLTVDPRVTAGPSQLSKDLLASDTTLWSVPGCACSRIGAM